MESLYEELRTVAAALETAGIEFALCGGLALAVHGHPRATKGIDLIVRREDLGRVRSVARACGFVLESLPMKFSGSGIEIERVSKIVGADVLMLDLLIANDVLAPVFESRVRVPWGDKELPVVSRAGLISMKLTAGRPQDLADLARLQESE